tara:strand:+ start:214 stop:1278 length:1065 start_codon:yes stop_codon:yes gene_type:complete
MSTPGAVIIDRDDLNVKHEKFCVSIENSGVSAGTDINDTILGSLLRAGVGMPYECNSGGCGSCKFTLIEGTISEDEGEWQGLRPSDVRKNKHLACVSRAQSDCLINVKLDSIYEPKIKPFKSSARFVSSAPLTHDLWEFEFKSDGPAFFMPGQYAKLIIPGVSGPRSYSMSNIANSDGRWFFQIKRVPEGEATSVLFERIKEGQLITIDGPYSIAHLNTNSPNSVVCIAGGSGLAPMVSIIRGIAEDKGSAAGPILYYGARSPRDVVDPEYFSSIKGFDSTHQYVPVVSEAKPGEWIDGPTGFVHEHLQDALPVNCSNIDFYIAGPPPMVEAVRRHLVLERKVPMEHLHYDRFF